MASENQDPKSRVPRGGAPPKLNLAEAGEVITALYERAGSAATSDEISEILGNSLKSSAFGKKINILKKYGLIVSDLDKFRLTDTAEAIVAPEDQSQRAAALKESFLQQEPFAKVYNKYVGRLLPEDDFLKNSFLEFGGKELAEEWAGSFKISAEFAGLLTDRGDGKFQVRETGKAGAPIKESVRSQEPAAAPEEESYFEPTIQAKTTPTIQGKTDSELILNIMSPDMSQPELDAVWTLLQYVKRKEAEQG